jgi:hypothetical protein
MQSSVGLAFRALVMLVCLALVPFLAICGKQLPDFYRAVVDAYKARTQPKAADPLAALGSDAPPWAPTIDRSSPGPAGRTPPGASNTPPVPGAALPGAPAPWNNADTMARPLATANGASVAPAGGVEPASFAAPTDASKPADPIATPGQISRKTAALAPAAAADSCSVQFRHVEQRLRELGATYYCLEIFGDGYRFYCEVALAGNTNNGHNRAFQATDPDPLQAMKKVLDQVEPWRSGQVQ